MNLETSLDATYDAKCVLAIPFSVTIELPHD